MKTLRQNLIVVVLVLLTMPAAFAYYCPSTGRWLSRDPMGEPGFENLRAPSMVPEIGQATNLILMPAGRWINRDPIAGMSAPNLYGFVINDPINKIDPFGLDDWSPNTLKTWKDLLERLKDAWEVSQHGKCPGDPCLSVTS